MCGVQACHFGVCAFDEGPATLFLQAQQTEAKKKFEDAMQRMIDKRNAADDAVYGGASSPA